MNRKRWFASRTILVNAAVAALLAMEAGTGLLQPLLPVNIYALVAFSLPVINAVLRIVTNQGLCK